MPTSISIIAIIIHPANHCDLLVPVCLEVFGLHNYFAGEDGGEVNFKVLT